MTGNLTKPKSGTILTLIAKGFLVDCPAKWQYNTHIHKELIMYTLIVFRKDKRCKSGEREYLRRDYDTDNLNVLEHTVKHTWPPSQFRTEIHKTYVTRKNMMTGREYQERFDTPYSCSPSSETYWSM